MISPLAGSLAQLNAQPSPAASADDPITAEAIAGTIGSHLLLGGTGAVGSDSAGLGRALVTSRRREIRRHTSLADAMNTAALAPPEMQAQHIDQALAVADQMAMGPQPVPLDRPIQAAIGRMSARALEAGDAITAYSKQGASQTVRALAEGTQRAMTDLTRAFGGADPKSVREAYTAIRPALAEAAARPEMAAQRADAAMGLRAHDPRLADQVAELGVRRQQYLYETMPKAPDGFGDDWEPSDSDLWTWARRVHAADRPDVITDEIKAGSVMPETVETLERLSPAHLDRVREEMTRALAEPGTKIPYAMRTGLALVLGIDDPELRPQAIAAAQARLGAAQAEATEIVQPTGAPGQQAPAPSQARYAPSRMEPKSHQDIQMQMTRAQKLEER